MSNFNTFRSFFVAASLALGTFAFTSCDKEDDGPIGAYTEEGVFVVDEGVYSTPNGNISFYNKNTKQVQTAVFSKENNNRPLGDVIQNMVIHGDQAFLVANNSNKIEVVNAYTFKSVGVVEGLAMPRYFTAVPNSNKGYVSEWVAFGTAGRVAVIDLKTLTVTKTISLAAMPEQLLYTNGKLYVANSGSNTLSVINTTTDVVEKTIPVAEAPSSLVLDKNNSLWVLSNGVKYTAHNTPGALSKINLTSNTVASTFTFQDKEASSGNLAINGAKNKLYYNYGGKVYQQDITAGTLNTTALINRNFYGLGVDPETGFIYGSVASYTSGSTIYVYKPDGTQITTFTAGIGSNGFVFN